MNWQSSCDPVGSTLSSTETKKEPLWLCLCEIHTISRDDLHMWTEHRKVICFTSISSHIPCHSSPQEERTVFEPMFPFQGNHRQAKQWWRGRSLYSGGSSLGMIFIRLGGHLTMSEDGFWLSELGMGHFWHLGVGTREAAKHPVSYRAALCDEIHSRMSTVERWRSPGVVMYVMLSMQTECNTSSHFSCSTSSSCRKRTRLWDVRLRCLWLARSLG